MNQTTALTLVMPSPIDTAQLVTDEEPLTALEERQNLLAHHVRLLARGMSVGLFVYGSQGGLGKSTHRAANTCRRGRVPGLGEQPYHASRPLYDALFQPH